MKPNIPFQQLAGIHAIRICVGLISILITTELSAQQTVVLPGNGTYSQGSSPQGGLRAQREFYLVSPKEMRSNGLTNGMAINSIGFTLGVAQDTTTMGSFKVYLQNTTDTVSRIDTSWITASSTANSYMPQGYSPEIMNGRCGPNARDFHLFLRL